MPTTDLVRVIRIYEFAGERAAVEAQITRSLHGTRLIKPGLWITGASLHEFPEMLDTRSAAMLTQLSNMTALLEDKDAEIASLRAERDELLNKLDPTKELT